MLQRTYRPLVDSAQKRFAGFESKAVDFDSGFAVARIGSTVEGGGPDPMFYDIFAVELESKRFLFKVEAWAREVGETNGYPMVSAATIFCDGPAISADLAGTESAATPSTLNPKYSTKYGFDDADEYELVTSILTAGVRRLNFSCDLSRFNRRPLQYYAEFVFQNPPGSTGANAPTDPSLGALLASRQYIDTGHAIERSPTLNKTRFAEGTPLASALLSREKQIKQLAEAKLSALTEEARVWIADNDRARLPDDVLATLSDPPEAAMLSDLEWVLAQLVSLEPELTAAPSDIPPKPVSLEQAASAPSVQKTLCAIYTDRFAAEIASFDTFYSQIIFALTLPYIIRRDDLALSRVEHALAREREDYKKAEKILAAPQRRRRFGLWPF